MKSIERLAKRLTRDWRGYVLGILFVALATWLKYLAQPDVIPANAPILYIAAIVPTAIFFGLGPSLFVCILSVLTFSYFFIPPLYSFSNFSIQEAPIILIFLLVGIVLSYLAAMLQRRTREAEREIESRKRSEVDLARYRDHLEEMIKIETSNLEAANSALKQEIVFHEQAVAEREQLGEKRQHLLNLSRAVIAEKHMDALLAKVSSTAQALTSSRLATCGHIFADGHFMAGGVRWEGGQVPCPPGKSFNMEKGGVYRDLLETRESILLTQEQLVRHPNWWGLPDQHVPLNGLLGVRLTNGEGRPNGVIMVSDKIEGEFTELDEYFLKQLASITSLAMQNIVAHNEVELKAKELENRVEERTRELSRVNEDLRLYLQRITRIQEEERARIARELHDDTAQYLALLSLELDSLIYNRENRLPKLTETLQRLKKDTERAMNEVRRFSHELNPSLLEHAGLEAALEQLVAETMEKTALQINLEVRGEECSTDSEKKLALFRIAQEALSNIRKHSQATSATIKLECLADRIQLQVSDNGKGFNLEEDSQNAIEKGRMGLLSMRERARLTGAELRLESSPGAGTVVSVKMPL